MRFCAVSCCQRRIATCSMVVCPLLTTSVPLSMNGWSTDIAPLKKKSALLSSSEPANSSMLNGPVAVPGEPSAFLMPSPVSSALACATPTWKLSNVT